MADCAGSKRTELKYKSETLDTGFHFNLSDNTVRLFLWQDGGRWKIGNPRADFT